jgi:FkbM family methyltransferase
MKFSVFMGRSWRSANRRLSRLYITLTAKRTSFGMTRIGSAENGWYMPNDLQVGARCYCIGVGRDASFDFELAKRGAEVHAFDPTPHAIAYMESENEGRVHFHPWGVMHEDTTIRLYYPFDETHGSYFAEDLHGTGKYHEVPCLRMATIGERLNHPRDSLYLVKVDIEGSWFQVLPDMVASKILPDFLEVEYDSPAPIWRVRPVHRTLERAGYRVVLQENDNVIYKRSHD